MFSSFIQVVRWSGGQEVRMVRVVLFKHVNVYKVCLGKGSNNQNGNLRS